MDLEALKAIAEIIESLGEQGAKVFLWYLAVDFAKLVVEGVVILGVFFVCFRQVKNGIVEYGKEGRR